MHLFSSLRTYPGHWTVQNTRLLTKEEKEFIKCAIVVKSSFGYSLEFFVKKGIAHIPITLNTDTTIGFVPNIDNIRVITLERDYDKEIIYRVEF